MFLLFVHPWDWKQLSPISFFYHNLNCSETQNEADNHQLMDVEIELMGVNLIHVEEKQ